MNYFRNPNFSAARSTVVGDINCLSTEERWLIETALFVEALMPYAPQEPCAILDYGCGIGRVDKKLLERHPHCTIVGVDNSEVQLAHARAYVQDPRFQAVLPDDVEGAFDFAFSFFVLQHVRAIHLRQAIQLIHAHLVPGGLFVHCCSERRMAIRDDCPRFFDDRFLGVDVTEEIELLFEPLGELFSAEDLQKETVLRRIVLGETGNEAADDTEVMGDPHPARIYRRRDISVPYWRLPMT